MNVFILMLKFQFYNIKKVSTQIEITKIKFYHIYKNKKLRGNLFGVNVKLKITSI